MRSKIFSKQLQVCTIVGCLNPQWVVRTYQCTAWLCTALHFTKRGLSTKIVIAFQQTAAAACRNINMFIDRSMSREYAFQTASEYEVLRCEPFTVNIVVDAEQFNTYSQPSSVSWPRGYETRRPRTQAEYQNRWPVRCRPGLHSSPLYVGTWCWRHGAGGRFPELTWYRRRVGIQAAGAGAATGGIKSEDYQARGHWTHYTGTR